MNEKVDQLSRDIWKKSVDIFTNLEDLRLVIINIRISVAQLGNLPEARALNTVADYIQNEITKLEDTTKDIREMSKQIGKVNKES